MHEQRVISFRDSEVAQALSLFREKSEFEPLGFDSLKVSERNGDPVVECHDRERNQPHRYSDHELCSALMLYCIAQKVPLPRRASKAVYMSADGIKLVITLGQL
jgi:hypothetical protein